MDLQMCPAETGGERGPRRPDPGDRAKETVTAPTPTYPTADATVENRSDRGIEVAVLDGQTQEQIRGFGLNGRADRNGSAQSIPLLIPGVMDPNLSPFSNSGVSLEMEQEILFREGGETYVLLTVDASIEEGETLEVSALLKARRRELGLR